MDRPKGGRPRKPTDWELVDELLNIQCTDDEIFGVAKISRDALLKDCKDTYNMSFHDYGRQKREGGKSSLRRAMWKKALDPDNTAATIFACKAYLGLKDYHPSTLEIKNTVQPLSATEKDKLIAEISQKFEAECDGEK